MRAGSRGPSPRREGTGHELAPAPAPRVLCANGKPCPEMQQALAGRRFEDKLGLAVGRAPPHVLALKCQVEMRGKYAYLILRFCPWCGAKRPCVTPRAEEA